MSNAVQHNTHVVHVFKGEGRHPWYVRLVANNGQTVAVSEGYYSKWNAKRAAKRMFPDLVVLYYMDK